MANNDYWAEREEKWIMQQIKDDALVAKKIELELSRAMVDINKDITAFYTNYAKSQNISMAEAMARVSAFDVKAFEFQAKKMVQDKDFSPNANERLKLYNATMKINRLENLKSQIGQELVKSNSKIEKLMGEKLTSAYQKRVERQAGILSEQQLKDVLKSAQTIVNADFQGATWSDRIWANNDTLKSRLEQLLTRSLVQGINPNVLARSLRDQFKKEFDNARYMAERLMRTETARVQDAAQMKSFEKYGYKYVKWIAEPSACKICLGIASDNDGVYSIDEVPTIPVHANCRCSKAAYVPEKSDFDAASWNDTFKNDFDIPNVDLSSVDKDYLPALHKEMGEFYKQFPQIKGYLNNLTSEDKTMSSNVLADSRGVKLRLNAKFFSDANKITETQREQFKSGFTSGDSTIKHELGHNLNSRLYNEYRKKEGPLINYKGDYFKALRKDIDKYTSGLMSQAFKDAGYTRTPVNIEKFASEYGKTNIAELFTETLNSTLTNNPVRDALIKLIMKEFG